MTLPFRSPSQVLLGVATMLAFQFPMQAQTLSVKWEELTAADFNGGIQKSHGTCVLPFGIIEKHGPQLPLGTDLINVRHVAQHAAEQEYAVVFPEYYFGQIFEAKPHHLISSGAIIHQFQIGAVQRDRTGGRFFGVVCITVYGALDASERRG